MDWSGGHKQTDSEMMTNDNSDELLADNITPKGNINSMNKVVNLLRNDIIDPTFANKFLGQNNEALSDAIAKQNPNNKHLSSSVADNAIMHLNEWCTMNFTHKPEFECSSTGASNCPTHTVTCKLVYKEREHVTTGSATTKREAKNLAVIAMIDKLEKVQQNLASMSNDECVVNKAMVTQTNAEHTSSATHDNCGENISTDAITRDETHGNSDIVMIDSDANKRDVTSNNAMSGDISAECKRKEFSIKLIDINDDKRDDNTVSISRQDSDTVSVDNNDNSTAMPCIANPMNYLFEWCQKNHIQMPQFVDTKSSGHDHCQSFTITCKLVYNEREYLTSSCGRSVKDAKKSAAFAMINELKIGPQIKQTNNNLPQSKPLPVVDNDKPNAELCLTADYRDIPSELIKTNPKGYINELCSKRSYKVSYEDKTSSVHCNGVFTFECVIDVKGDRITGRGSDNRKKDAQQLAAKDAIAKYFEMRSAQKYKTNAIPVEEETSDRRDDNTFGIKFFKKFSFNSELETVLRNIQKDEYNMQTLDKILAKIDCSHEAVINSDDDIVALSIIWRENGVNVLIARSYAYINGSLERAKDIAAKKAILTLNVLKFSS